MRLASNTFVYEQGKVHLKEALVSAQKFGFKFIDLAAWNSGDPTLISKAERKDLVKMFKDLGFTSSQVLALNTHHMASSKVSMRKKVMDYMKKCADLQLDLGGKQVLIGFGGGVYEDTVVKEQTWMNSVNTIREYAKWCLDKGILVELSMEPGVYFLIHNLEGMVKMMEDVEMPNIFPHVDICHLCLTREPPKNIGKIGSGLLHVHLTDTDFFQHDNRILGSGKADIKSYIDKIIELGIEENCKKYGEVAVAGIELGNKREEVDDPDRWIQESLSYLKNILPELTM